MTARRIRRQKKAKKLQGIEFVCADCTVPTLSRKDQEGHNKEKGMRKRYKRGHPFAMVAGCSTNFGKLHRTRRNNHN